VPLSHKDVAEILKVIDASQCDEVVLELDDIRLVVRRSTGGSPGAPVAAPARPAPPSAAPKSPAPAAPPTTSRSAPKPPSKVAAQTAPGRIEIRAPMVGTFYRRPSPQDAPFVEVGRKIARGAPLGLIEVMKLYTTIEAQADGVVEQILAEDGALVEFDQLLFVIKPA
jgi:acetyl-CoA carboxylase biotin carboxyl carrier protein